MQPCWTAAGPAVATRKLAGKAIIINKPVVEVVAAPKQLPIIPPVSRMQSSRALSPVLRHLPPPELSSLHKQTCLSCISFAPGPAIQIQTTIDMIRFGMLRV